MSTYVLYHANCPDGFAAALVCWQHFGETDTHYLPVKYGDPPPDMPDGADVYIVDFSYPKKVLLDLLKNHSITLIDHHKTAVEELSDFHHGRLAIILNEKESGASLTWKAFGVNATEKEMPDFFKYIRDRDLWLWEMPDSKEFSAALASHEKDFELWDRFIGNEQVLMNEGTAILRYQDKMIDTLRRNAELHELDQHRIMVVNTPYFGSEIGNKLCADYKDIAFAVCYSKQPDGRWRYELRSVGEFDVSEVAKNHGGGGHRNAAGFILESLIFP